MMIQVVAVTCCNYENSLIPPENVLCLPPFLSMEFIYTAELLNLQSKRKRKTSKNKDRQDKLIYSVCGYQE